MCYFTIVPSEGEHFIGQPDCYQVNTDISDSSPKSNIHLPLLDCLTLKLKALPFTVPLVTNYRLARRNISEESILQRHGRDN
jgi:hypothetical protein